MSEHRTMALTQKEHEKRYDDLVRRQTKLVRGMFQPPSIAERMYPHLPTRDQPKRPPIGKKEK